MYQRLEFGPDAKPFIRLRLSIGPTLAQLLCELPLELGKAIAFLPPAPKLWDLLHFAWAINSRDDLENGRVDREYRHQENNVIADFLKEGSRNAAFFYRNTFTPEMRPKSLVRDPLMKNYSYNHT